MKLFFHSISNLYARTNYTSPAISIINRITEYDIKSAGYSVSKKYKLITPNKLKLLKEMKSLDRSIYIGKLQLQDKELNRLLPAFMKAERMKFFMANHIQDDNILSIKNDAIFIVGLKCKHTDFGDVQFMEKNVYSSYHNINGIEMFYKNKEDKLDIKGINDTIVDEHEKGIIEFLKTCFKYIEYGKTDKLKKYLISFSNDYKSRKLPLIYYKSFSTENCYFINENGSTLQIPYIEQKMLKDISIAYNFNFYILPILNRYLFQNNI